MTRPRIPPGFTTLWKQAEQQSCTPKVATTGEALLFPSAVEAHGDTADGLSTEVWWTPTAGCTSSLTGQSAREPADAFEEATGQQWTEPLGSAHALFEVAVTADEEAGSTEAEAVDAALDSLSVSTVVGEVAWGCSTTKSSASPKAARGSVSVDTEPMRSVSSEASPPPTPTRRRSPRRR